MTNLQTDSGERIAASLAPSGLVLLGAVRWPSQSAELLDLLLLGDAAGSLWPAFQSAPEATDGEPDPLDRWTRRVVDSVAREHGMRAIYPFDGPPFAPFLAWSIASGSAASTPLGLVMHRRYGLWHAYRAALVVGGGWPTQVESSMPPMAETCLHCVTRPCLRACPVDAFDSLMNIGQTDTECITAYNLRRCVEHLETPMNRCLEGGCLARNACPVTPAGRYSTAQQRFLLQAFLRGDWQGHREDPCV